MKMWLKRDITSHFKPLITYGKKGDEVIRISGDEFVSLVERSDGYRFSCRTEYLSPEKQDMTQIIEVNNISKPSTVQKQKRKPATPKQKSLFK